MLYVVQCALGALIHFFKPAIARRRAPQNYVHAVIGLTLIGLAFWQVRTGYRKEWPETTGRGKAPKGVNVAWIVWVVVSPSVWRRCLRVGWADARAYCRWCRCSTLRGWRSCRGSSARRRLCEAVKP